MGVFRGGKQPYPVSLGGFESINSLESLPTWKNEVHHAG
jgi:hypothetical protein